MTITASVARLTLLLAVALPLAAQAPPAGHFTLQSSDFSAGGKLPEAQVYNGFGCHGGNTSPALRWSGAPQGTQSFVLMVHDPDAPTGSGWWHWVVYNLPAGTSALPAGAGDTAKGLLPPGTLQGRTDFGAPGYGGPCPPPGAPHHYNFRIYALKVPRLEVPADASPALIASSAHAQALASAELVGLYGR
jgi:Raf kinase inhibitor-like YbhB/YbcL family protein